MYLNLKRPLYYLVLGMTLAVVIFPAYTFSRNRQKLHSTKTVTIPRTPTQRMDRFGVYNWNINDSAFSSDEASDRLNWGANKVAELGSRTIRVAITTRDDYRVNPPGNLSLAQIAQSSAYDKLFRDSRFKTYLLTAYSRGATASDWADGFTPTEQATERDEIKTLCEYLLNNPAFTGKTFIILNWEGDSAIVYHTNKQSVWDSYISWIRARAEGVKLAKQNSPGSNVNLFSGLEFSAVRRNGKPCGSAGEDPVNDDPLKHRCVVDYVAPQVEVDYYSYSSWQTLVDKEVNPNASLIKIYKRDLDFALSKIKMRRPEITEPNFIIGEFGFERSRYGECYAANYLNEMFDVFDGENAFHVSYAIFWQVIDNNRLYGLLDERFGLFRVKNQMLDSTLLSESFQKRIAGKSVASYTGCPRIRQYPEPPGLLNQQGTPEFRLNPDTIGSIYVPNCCQSTASPFSASGNTIHFNQTLQNYLLPRDNDTNFYESTTQVNFSMPPARRPGYAWVYVTDARGLESNAQTIAIECNDCPKIDTNCGVLDATWQTLQIEPGMTITISGSRFSPSGNTIVIEQLEQQQTTRRWTLPRESLLTESPTRILAQLPSDLPAGYTLVHVVNSQGLRSGESIIALSLPCPDCGPRLKPCAGIVNEAGSDFSTGTVATVFGRFAPSGNKIVIEQFDQYGFLYRQTLTQGSIGWDETDKRIKFTLPFTLFPGRALIYTMDAEGRESRAQSIQLKPTGVTSVSAASYKGPALAEAAIVSAFGSSLSTSIEVATVTPLPTELAGTQILIKDSAGIEQLAPLYFVSPTQVNFQIPAGTALGTASINVKTSAGILATGTARIVKVAPGLFSANANGQGIAAAVVLRIRSDGSQIFEPVAVPDQATNQLIPLPIDLGPETDQVFLILFGTGIHSYSASAAVKAAIGGVESEISFAGAHPSLIGVDQVNLRLSRALTGRGDVDVMLTVDGLSANPVRVSIK